MRTFLRFGMLVTAIVAPLALVSQEAAATPYTFSSSGAFSDCAGCSIATGSSEIGWGGSRGINSFNYDGSTMTAVSLSNQTGNTPNNHDEIGALSWTNQSTESGNTSPTVTANYTLTLNFSNPQPGGAVSDALNLNVTNTPNNARVCFFIFCSNTGDVNDTTGVSGGSNTLSVDGLTLSNFTFVATGGSTFDSSTGIWSNPEGNVAGLLIYATISNTPASVPEPFSLALLGTGVLGMTAIRRMRRLR